MHIFHFSFRVSPLKTNWTRKVTRGWYCPAKLDVFNQNINAISMEPTRI